MTELNNNVLIDVQHLTKAFGDHVVLKDISEHINEGEKVVIIGPSGGGKSTFLRCLNLHLQKEPSFLTERISRILKQI